MTRHLEDLLGVFLTADVARMGLARKDELNGALGVADNLGQAIDVGKDQRCALVGCKSAGKADGQHGWIEHVGELFDR